MRRLRASWSYYGQVLRLRLLRWFFGGETYICSGCGALVRADLHPSTRCGLTLPGHKGWIDHFREREQGVARELKEIREKTGIDPKPEPSTRYQPGGYCGPVREG